MGGIVRMSLVRFLYSFVASMAAYISLWHSADLLKDRISAGFRPARSSYDFIVVGAGSAGSVVAHRLAQKYHVLLLEAGGDPYVLSHIPGFALALLNYPQIDWMHTTVPQQNACLALKNQESGWSQGKGLGGTSNTNFMIHSRGHPRDFETWAKITGDPSWSYDGVLKYFNRMEDYRGEYSGSELHGSGGPMQIELPPERGNAHLFVEAGREFGYDKVDLNGRFTQGFDIINYFIKRGRRHGAYAAYIKPVRQKRTLTIEKFSVVHKIIFNDKNEACGVEYERHGQMKQAFVTKEVILSAGAVQSPKILMLSGVGPRGHLESLNIDVKHDSPQVGQNLQDHISLYLGPFEVAPHNSILLDRDIKVADFIEFFGRGTGILTTTGIQAMGFFATSHAQAAGQGDWPDIQLMYAGIGSYDHYAKHFAHGFHVREDVLQRYLQNSTGKDSFTVITSLARPVQRGEILLKSADPNEKLHIDPKYLQDDRDVRVIVEGVRKTVELVENSKSLRSIGAKFTSDPFPGCENIKFRTDAYWECFIRHLSITLHHIVGTCAMGPANSTSVVDPELRVHGVKNLRVVDASVMPTVPVGNTNSPTVMIGEKAADLILEQWAQVGPSASRPVYQQSAARLPSFSEIRNSQTTRAPFVFGLNKQYRWQNPYLQQGNFNGKPRITSIVSAPSPIPASNENLQNLLNIKTLIDEMETSSQTASSPDASAISTTSERANLGISPSSERSLDTSSTSERSSEFSSTTLDSASEASSTSERSSSSSFSSSTSRSDDDEDSDSSANNFNTKVPRVEWKDIDKSDLPDIASLNKSGTLPEATQNLNMLVNLMKSDGNGSSSSSENFFNNMTLSSSTEKFLETSPSLFSSTYENIILNPESTTLGADSSQEDRDLELPGSTTNSVGIISESVEEDDNEKRATTMTLNAAENSNSDYDTFEVEKGLRPIFIHHHDDDEDNNSTEGTVLPGKGKSSTTKIKDSTEMLHKVDSELMETTPNSMMEDKIEEEIIDDTDLAGQDSRRGKTVIISSLEKSEETTTLPTLEGPIEKQSKIDEPKDGAGGIVTGGKIDEEPRSTDAPKEILGVGKSSEETLDKEIDSSTETSSIDTIIKITTEESKVDAEKVPDKITEELDIGSLGVATTTRKSLTGDKTDEEESETERISESISSSTIKSVIGQNLIEEPTNEDSELKTKVTDIETSTTSNLNSREEGTGDDDLDESDLDAEGGRNSLAIAKLKKTNKVSMDTSTSTKFPITSQKDQQHLITASAAATMPSEIENVTENNEVDKKLEDGEGTERSSMEENDPFKITTTLKNEFAEKEEDSEKSNVGQGSTTTAATVAITTTTAKTTTTGIITTTPPTSTTKPSFSSVETTSDASDEVTTELVKDKQSIDVSENSSASLEESTNTPESEKNEGDKLSTTLPKKTENVENDEEVVTEGNSFGQQSMQGKGSILTSDLHKSDLTPDGTTIEPAPKDETSTLFVKTADTTAKADHTDDLENAIESPVVSSTPSSEVQNSDEQLLSVPDETTPGHSVKEQQEETLTTIMSSSGDLIEPPPSNIESKNKKFESNVISTTPGGQDPDSAENVETTAATSSNSQIFGDMDSDKSAAPETISHTTSANLVTEVEGGARSDDKFSDSTPKEFIKSTKTLAEPEDSKEKLSDMRTSENPIDSETFDGTTPEPASSDITSSTSKPTDLAAGKSSTIPPSSGNDGTSERPSKTELSLSETSSTNSESSETETTISPISAELPTTETSERSDSETSLRKPENVEKSVTIATSSAKSTTILDDTTDIVSTSESSTSVPNETSIENTEIPSVKSTSTEIPTPQMLDSKIVDASASPSSFDKKDETTQDLTQVFDSTPANLETMDASSSSTKPPGSETSPEVEETSKNVEGAQHLDAETSTEPAILSITTRLFPEDKDSAEIKWGEALLEPDSEQGTTINSNAPIPTAAPPKISSKMEEDYTETSKLTTESTETSKSRGDFKSEMKTSTEKSSSKSLEDTAGTTESDDTRSNTELPTSESLTNSPISSTSNSISSNRAGNSRKLDEVPDENNEIDSTTYNAIEEEPKLNLKRDHDDHSKNFVEATDVHQSSTTSEPGEVMTTRQIQIKLEEKTELPTSLPNTEDVLGATTTPNSVDSQDVNLDRPEINRTTNQTKLEEAPPLILQSTTAAPSTEIIFDEATEEPNTSLMPRIVDEMDLDSKMDPNVVTEKDLNEETTTITNTILNIKAQEHAAQATTSRSKSDKTKTGESATDVTESITILTSTEKLVSLEEETITQGVVNQKQGISTKSFVSTTTKRIPDGDATTSVPEKLVIPTTEINQLIPHEDSSDNVVEEEKVNNNSEGQDKIMVENAAGKMLESEKDDDLTTATTTMLPAMPGKLNETFTKEAEPGVTTATEITPTNIPDSVTEVIQITRHATTTDTSIRNLMAPPNLQENSEGATTVNSIDLGEAETTGKIDDLFDANKSDNINKTKPEETTVDAEVAVKDDDKLLDGTTLKAVIESRLIETDETTKMADASMSAVDGAVQMIEETTAGPNFFNDSQRENIDVLKDSTKNSRFDEDEEARTMKSTTKTTTSESYGKDDIKRTTWKPSGDPETDFTDETTLKSAIEVETATDVTDATTPSISKTSYGVSTESQKGRPMISTIKSDVTESTNTLNPSPMSFQDENIDETTMNFMDKMTDGTSPTTIKSDSAGTDLGFDSTDQINQEATTSIPKATKDVQEKKDDSIMSSIMNFIMNSIKSDSVEAEATTTINVPSESLGKDEIQMTTPKLEGNSDEADNADETTRKMKIDVGRENKAIIIADQLNSSTESRSDLPDETTFTSAIETTTDAADATSPRTLISSDPAKNELDVKTTFTSVQENSSDNAAETTTTSSDSSIDKTSARTLTSDSAGKDRDSETTLKSVRENMSDKDDEEETTTTGPIHSDSLSFDGADATESKARISSNLDETTLATMMILNEENQNNIQPTIKSTSQISAVTDGALIDSRTQESKDVKDATSSADETGSKLGESLTTTEIPAAVTTFQPMISATSIVKNDVTEEGLGDEEMTTEFLKHNKSEESVTTSAPSFEVTTEILLTTPQTPESNIEFSTSQQISRESKKSSFTREDANKFGLKPKLNSSLNEISDDGSVLPDDSEEFADLQIIGLTGKPIMAEDEEKTTVKNKITEKISSKLITDKQNQIESTTEMLETTTDGVQTTESSADSTEIPVSSKILSGASSTSSTTERIKELSKTNSDSNQDLTTELPMGVSIGESETTSKYPANFVTEKELSENETPGITKNPQISDSKHQSATIATPVSGSEAKSSEIFGDLTTEYYLTTTTPEDSTGRLNDSNDFVTSIMSTSTNANNFQQVSTSEKTKSEDKFVGSTSERSTSLDTSTIFEGEMSTDATPTAEILAKQNLSKSFSRIETSTLTLSDGTGETMTNLPPTDSNLLVFDETTEGLREEDELSTTPLTAGVSPTTESMGNMPEVPTSATSRKMVDDTTTEASRRGFNVSRIASEIKKLVQSTSKEESRTEKAIAGTKVSKSDRLSDDFPAYDVEVDIPQPDDKVSVDLIEKEVQSISKAQSREEKTFAEAKTLVSKSESPDEFQLYDVEVTIEQPDHPGISADLIEKEIQSISHAQSRTEKAISVSQVKVSKSESDTPLEKHPQEFYDVEVNITQNPVDFFDSQEDNSDDESSNLSFPSEDLLKSSTTTTTTASHDLKDSTSTSKEFSRNSVITESNGNLEDGDRSTRSTDKQIETTVPYLLLQSENLEIPKTNSSKDVQPSNNNNNNKNGTFTLSSVMDSVVNYIRGKSLDFFPPAPNNLTRESGQKPLEKSSEIASATNKKALVDLESVEPADQETTDDPTDSSSQIIPSRSSIVEFITETIAQFMPTQFNSEQEDKEIEPPREDDIIDPTTATPLQNFEDETTTTINSDSNENSLSDSSTEFPGVTDPAVDSTTPVQTTEQKLRIEPKELISKNKLMKTDDLNFESTTSPSAESSRTTLFPVENSSENLNEIPNQPSMTAENSTKISKDDELEGLKKPLLLTLNVTEVVPVHESNYPGAAFSSNSKNNNVMAASSEEGDNTKNETHYSEESEPSTHDGASFHVDSKNRHIDVYHFDINLKSPGKSDGDDTTNIPLLSTTTTTENVYKSGKLLRAHKGITIVSAEEIIPAAEEATEKVVDEALQIITEKDSNKAVVMETKFLTEKDSRRLFTASVSGGAYRITISPWLLPLIAITSSCFHNMIFNG